MPKLMCRKVLQGPEQHFAMLADDSVFEPNARVSQSAPGGVTGDRARSLLRQVGGEGLVDTVSMD
jgi:hypothetical protein